jgi:hypothetical protein
LGCPGCGCEFCEPLNRDVSEAGQNSGQVFPNRNLQPTAGLNNGQNGRHFRSGLLAPYVDPDSSATTTPEQDNVRPALESTEFCDMSLVEAEQQRGAGEQPIPTSTVADAVVSLLNNSPNRRLRLTQLAHMLRDRFPGPGKLAIRFGRASMREVLGAIPQILVLDDHKNDPTVSLTTDWDARA